MVDIVGAVLMLLLFSPIFLLVAVLIACDTGFPVLFTQTRIGKDKMPFTIYKFRTMYATVPSDVPTYQVKPRKGLVTPVGKWLRKSKLDELPQLWNILKGDMSLVGPRPALWSETALIDARDRYGINRLKPGLTGLAQVKGLQVHKVKSKVEWDRQYLSEASLSLDLYCLLITPFVLISSLLPFRGRNKRKR
ncbi:sugar transferase [Streptococcus suis]|uniref:sugar transferase n=1 Tax=Streptococcus suis TaxID=1307 RepID=UPI0038B89989